MTVLVGASNKEKALVGAFSGHCATSRRLWLAALVWCAGYGAGDVQRAGGGRGKVSVSTGLRTRPDVTQRSDTTSDRGWRLCNNLEGAGQGHI